MGRLAAALLLALGTGGAAARPFVAEEGARAAGNDDLLRLIDIIGVFPSPDGNKLAYFTRTPRPETNDYKQELEIIDVDTGRSLVRHDAGAPIMQYAAHTGLPYGTFEDVQALWTEDSATLIYIADRDGDIDAHAMSSAGVSSRITRVAGRILAIRKAPAGASILVSEVPRRSQLEGKRAEAGHEGYLYGSDFAPWATPLPTGPALVPSAQVSWPWIIDSRSLVARMASDGPGGDKTDVTPAPKSAQILDREGRVTALPAVDGLIGPGSDTILYYRVAHVFRRCEVAACRGAFGEAVSLHDGSIAFVRHEGLRRTRSRLYNLDTRNGKATAMSDGRDETLRHCGALNGGIVCIREQPTEPQELVMFRQGRSPKILADPNRFFRPLRKGRVEYLEWSSGQVATSGRLVYPLGYEAGKRYPLVITLYESSGFLRGGTGDEYPIFPLSAAGFFVLDVTAASQPGITARTPIDYMKVARANANDKVIVLRSLEAAIEQLRSRGLVDATRVGLGGLSYGAETTNYAISHSDAFAAAVASGPGLEPSGYYLLGNDGAWLREIGYPDPSDTDFWGRISLSANAAKVRSPMLYNLADEEFLVTLESIAALRRARKVVEAYVYPGEHHIKWQPRHRRIIYERNLDWFRFWLKGEEDPRPAKAEQYVRWRQMLTRSTLSSN